MLNAFRHQRIGHGGGEYIRRARGAQRLSASTDRSRAEQAKQQAMNCVLTPFGINGSVTGEYSDYRTPPCVLNAFRHQGSVTTTPRAASTGVLVLNAFPASTDRSLQGGYRNNPVALCSTPFASTDRSLCEASLNVFCFLCSTPFGINGSVTILHQARPGPASCAQRLSASTDRSPSQGMTI